MTSDEMGGRFRSAVPLSAARHSSLVTRHWPLVLFAALATAFLSPVLFGDRALLPTASLMGMSPWAEARTAGAPPPSPAPWNPILWDAIAQFYPWRAFAAHWMRRGVIPLWDPHQFCGTPFLANSQSAVLYPLHLLLLDLPAGLPVARAMALLAAIHLTLAGFLTYLWLRALRLFAFPAALGGIAFMFSGFAVTWLELPSFLTVACWLPLLFLTVHRVLEAPSPRRAAGLAVAVGLTLLGGHLQIAFYCLLGAGLYVVWGMGIQAFRRSGVPAFRRSPVTPVEHEHEHEHDARAQTPERLNVWAPALLVVAVVLGGMVAAPQLLPAVELSGHSHRVSTTSAAGYRAYVRGAMPAAQLVRLFLPDFYGNPSRGDYSAGSPADYTEYAGYFGGVGLLLALTGLLAWRRRPRETLFAAGLGVLSLLLALGTPLNALFYFGIPGFSQSGSPARVLVLFCFAGAWLAGLGTQALLERRRWGEGERGRRGQGETGRQGDGETGGRAESRIPRLAVAALVGWMLLLGASLVPARLFVEGLGGQWGEFMARSGPAMEKAGLFAALAVLVPAGLRWLGGRGAVSWRLAEGLGQAVLGALLLGELWAIGAGFNPTGPMADVYPSTPLIDALRTGPAAEPGRVLPVNHRWSLIRNPHGLLPPNSALALGLMDTQGYDSLFPSSYKGLANLVQGADTAPLENGNMLFLSNLSSPLLPLLAADRVVIDTRDPALVIPHWPILYDQNGLRAYRYPTALPRAFVASSWRAVPPAAMPGELQRLAAAHGLRTTALVMEANHERGQATGSGAAASQVGVSDLGPNEVALTVPSPETGILVLLDNDYPSWRAVDGATGHSLPVEPVDLTFRGVRLAGVGRTVRMRYEPSSFRLGLYLSILAVGILVGVAVGGRRMMT